VIIASTSVSAGASVPARPVSRLSAPVRADRRDWTKDRAKTPMTGAPGSRVVLARGPAVRRRAPSSRGAHTRRAPDGRPVRRGAALSMARAEAGDSMGDSQPTTGQARDAPEKPATHTPESGSTLVDFTSLISVLQQLWLAA
jgi:hypothetical protein